MKQIIKIALDELNERHSQSNFTSEGFRDVCAQKVYEALLASGELVKGCIDQAENSATYNQNQMEFFTYLDPSETK